MTPGGTSRSVAERLDPRDNGLNFLRLILAAAVIISHCRPLGGYGDDPHIGDLGLGHLAVGGFFAVSGYLITASALKNSVVRFVAARALRIGPGLLANIIVIVIVLVFAPTVAIFRGGWSLTEAWEFFASKALTRETHQSVGATLTGLPGPDAWNGSLWTIRFELYCYMAAGVAALVPNVRRLRWLPLLGFAMASCASLAIASKNLPMASSTPAKVGLLVPFFLAGVLLLRYRKIVPLTLTGAAVALGLLSVVLGLGYGRALAALPLAYLVLWLSVNLPPRLRRLGSKNDLSYGMYLYGWPVTKMLVAAGVAQGGYALLCCVALILTLPFALISWFCVEQPAMRIRSYVSELEDRFLGPRSGVLWGHRK